MKNRIDPQDIRPSTTRALLFSFVSGTFDTWQIKKNPFPGYIGRRQKYTP